MRPNSKWYKIMMYTISELGKTSAMTLANFILQNFGPMSHLKLQKLLFYCQAYHLAYFEEPVFDEDFQAWVHGPVCRDVYNVLKGKSKLYADLAYEYENKEDSEHLNGLTSDQQDLLKDVLGSLSSWTAFQLETATHKESPWLEARVGFGDGDICDVVIQKERMKSYYGAELNGQV